MLGLTRSQAVWVAATFILTAIRGAATRRLFSQKEHERKD